MWSQIKISLSLTQITFVRGCREGDREVIGDDIMPSREPEFTEWNLVRGELVACHVDKDENYSA